MIRREHPASPAAAPSRPAQEARALSMDKTGRSWRASCRLEITPAMTPDDVRADLGALQQLWREKLAEGPLN